MGATVRISRRTAEKLHVALEYERSGLAPDLLRALDELSRALSSLKSPKRKAAKRASRVAKAREVATKKEARQDVRSDVMARAGGSCEGCGMPGCPLVMDHFFGRARAESLETCWALCRWCDRRKTNNNPSAERWLVTFIQHCKTHSYAAAAARARKRLAFVRARGALMGRGQP